MHILILPSWYPSNPEDLNGSFVREQIEAFDKTAHKISVIHPCLKSLRAPSKIIFKPHIQNEIDNDINTYRYHWTNWFPLIPNLQQFLFVKLGLVLIKKYIKKNGKPDIIHAHAAFNGGLLALNIFNKYNIPYVITEHSTDFKLNANPTKLRKAKNIYLNAKLCFAVSRSLKATLDSITSINWIVHHNSIGNQFTTPYLNKIDANPKKLFTYLTISILEPRKNIELIIESFSLAHQGDNNFRLIVGGDGPSLTHLRKLAKKLDVYNQVLFLGCLSRQQVLEHMRQCNVFVLGSNYETFGVVLIEAASQGKPVISTRCGGTEDIVNENTGILVPKNNVDAMAKAMRKMSEAIERFDSLKIREYCLNNFSNEALGIKLLEKYKHIIKNNCSITC